MKITISKFPNYFNRETWQVFIAGMPICKETDKQNASTLANELLHKSKGNELYQWDAYTGTETLIDRN